MVSENDLGEILAQELERIKECGERINLAENREAYWNQQGGTTPMAEQRLCHPTLKKRMAIRNKQA